VAEERCRAARLFFFQINDPEEKKRAWQRYDEIRGFVESDACRHQRICGHFGENKKWAACGACDVCAYEPAWLSAPVQVAPSKRKRSKSRSVSPSPPVPRSYERSLPTPEQTRFNEASEVDPDLREFLREWRRETAKEQNVAAFVVMHDTTLDAICRSHPASLRDLLMVSGIGERKAELYGRQILDALQRFSAGARSTSPDRRITPSEETIGLIQEGKTLEEIATIRGRRLSTIVSMVSDLVERGLVDFQHGWVS
jgi:ATP-dependent DNA helicase RecQ